MRAPAAAGDDEGDDERNDSESASLLPVADGENSGGAQPPPHQQQQQDRRPPASVWREVGPALRLGWPMLMSQYLDRSAQQLCVMLIGHIGPKELGAVVLATMWCNITGLSLVMGGMSGLNTLCAQAFGAGNYQRLGVLLQRAILMCLLLLIPIGISWWFVTAKILALIGSWRPGRETPPSASLNQMVQK
jgi:MATE family multidrug resistance protein|eukprot:COSAG06_NODE_5551_length_3406_cov_19.727245_5_plen_190_part_00